MGVKDSGFAKIDDHQAAESPDTSQRMRLSKIKRTELSKLLTKVKSNQVLK